MGFLAGRFFHANLEVRKLSQKLISVEVKKEFDVLNKNWQEQVYVKLYVAARTSGFLADISDRDWKTLCVLATFMDAQGNCYPSQIQIAEALGIGRQAANERISSLLRYRWHGRPIVTVAKTRKDVCTGKKGERWANNRYTILPLSNLGFGDSAEHDTGENLDFTKEKPMSSDHDIGKNLEFPDKKPMSPYPDTGKDDTNKIHNNVVVDVVVDDQPTASNCQQEEEPEHTRAAEDEPTPAVVNELRAAVQKATGAEVSADFLKELLKGYPEKAIREKIKLIGEMGAGTKVRNVPGLLMTALRENFQHIPGRIQTQARAAPEKKDGQTQIPDKRGPDEEERLRKKREALKALYLT